MSKPTKPKDVRYRAGGRTFTLRPHDNGTLYAHWTEGRRSKRVSCGTEDLDKAQAFVDEYAALMAKEAAGAGAWTCRALWDLKYGPGKVETESSRERLASAERVLMPFFGHLLPSEIDPDLVDDFLDARIAGTLGPRGRRAESPSTHRYELSVLYASWNHGVAKKVIASDDLPELDPLPEAAPARVRWLRKDEMAKIFEAARKAREASDEPHRLSRVERFIALALYTAARRTAILELTWDQVDLEEMEVDYLVKGAKQTSKRRASVTIHEELLPILRRAYEERTSDMVLDHDGRIVYDLNKVLALAGPAGKDVTPHVFRHTAAVHMLKGGASVWTVAQVLGNTVAMVEKVYAKWVPSFAREAVGKIPGGFFPVETPVTEIRA